MLHHGVHLDRFQRDRRGKINAEPRRMQLRIVDRALEHMGEQAAHDVAAHRWSPSPTSDSVWHITVLVADEIWCRRRESRDVWAVRQDIRLGHQTTTFMVSPLKLPNREYYSSPSSRMLFDFP